MRSRWFGLLLLQIIFAVRCLAADRLAEPGLNQPVGPLPLAAQKLPTSQIVRITGKRIEFKGRPVDLALSRDGSTLFVKNINNLLVVDAEAWTLSQTLPYPAAGASLHGIALNRAESRLYITGADDELYEWNVAGNFPVEFSRTMHMPHASDPCGLAISADGAKAYVCLSISNALAVVDLKGGTVIQLIKVGIAPWNVVLSSNGATAFVTDWGGRFPTGSESSAKSAGTPVVVDNRGVASSGVVSIVNLATGVEEAQVPVGLHPCDLVLSRDEQTLYVANANSDAVTAIDTRAHVVKETIRIRPDQALPFGSEPDGLALSADGKNLFVANAGNNAVAVVRLPEGRRAKSEVEGFFPTDWFPGAVAADKLFAFIANVKGLGTHGTNSEATSWKSSDSLGTIDRIPIPRGGALRKATASVVENGRIGAIKRAFEPAVANRPPVPVPAHVGEPSVFKHVLYILKENKTYDQMFGDISRGNGNSNLCIYPERVSPNHHALATQYVLLDNYYCNGVNSADGHSWSTEGNTTDHLEKSFGGFSRSYTFGDDPLTYSSTGFIWNNVLEHGLSFRNYGEFDYASVPSGATWQKIYTDFTNGAHSIKFAQNIGLAPLRPYSSTNVPGWNLGIPDVVRAYGFIKELKAAEAAGNWAAFHLLYLPNDHTGGKPPPQAQVADNDLALGQVVEAVTKSAFGSNSVIFVIEDDPQSGYDHVDGHRSICLVISPYTKRGQTISSFYNQAGVLHTMEQILGLPPMNQQDALGPLMSECFNAIPDFTPYTAFTNQVDLTTGGKSRLNLKAAQYFKKVQKMDFSKPDQINENTFNRYIWYSIKGNVPYPAEFVGGHGKGLKELGLYIDKSAKDADD
ncbi:MAG TPA: bifunctional YncE family protein/alkaline phosphatase family protein [Verrucomicrobiae bacterium]|jgi:YVTN family beta-propeller protein